MRGDEFQSQMARLIEQYGKAAYSPERSKLVWEAVKDGEHRWFEETVSRFLGEWRLPPLLPDFREAVAKEHERKYIKSKSQNTKEIHEIISKYHPDEIQNICGQIRNRAKGIMNDESFNSFSSMIDTREAYKCQQCEDTGAYFDKSHGGMTKCGHT